MSAFEYRALDAQKRVKRGVVQADTPRQARSMIRDQGLIPIQIELIARRQATRFMWGAQRERSVVLRQLSTLIRAGMTIEEVLTLLTEQADRAETRRAIGAIRSRVLEGQSLSVAMREQPQLFPRLYSASIAAAERTGQLDAVLGRLAEYAQSREAMGRGLGLALVYPALLAMIALLVVSALIGWVVPRIVGVFEQAGQALPAITQSLLSLSDLVTGYGWMVVLIFFGLTLALMAWLRKDEARLKFDGWMLQLPLVGRLVESHQTARMTRTLAILMGSAVPLVEALTVSASVLGNRRCASDITDVANRVTEGVSLSKSLQSVDWVSGIVKRLVHAGERSGELAAMLNQSADIEERQLESAQAVVLSVIQPLMILLVGLMVLYIVLAIMLPILNVSQLLGGS